MPHAGLAFGLGDLAQDVVSASGLFIQSLLGSINFMFQVAELAQEETSLASLVVGHCLDFIQLGGQSRLGLAENVKVVVEVSNNAEHVSILNGNLALGTIKIRQSKIGLLNLLGEVIQSGNQILVRLVRRGLGTDDFVSGSPGISNLMKDVILVLVNLGFHLGKLINLFRHLLDSILVLPFQVADNGFLLNVGLLQIFAKFANLGLSLLVQLNLGTGGSTSLIEALAKLFNLAS